MLQDLKITVLCIMKSSELHRLVKRNGWKHFKTEGSHYIYEKDGLKYPVPFHGSKEVGTGLLKQIFKVMKLNY